MGSNTKQFAAVSILKLAEGGRLSLADPLSKFFPDYPNGPHITVHELLNHTSGIKDYMAIEGYFQSAIRQDVDTAKLIDVFKNQPVDFAPGTDWKYSNSGYILVGAILEKLTGKPWHDAIRELVLAPLALTHTSYDSDQVILAGRAAGYSVDEAHHDLNAPYISMTQAGAAGGLVSNVDDLFHWMRSVHSGKFLDAENYRRFITPMPTPSGEPADYGYGIETHKLRGLRTLEHAGRDPGFMSYMLYVPDASISVVALANTDSPPYDISVLAYKLAASTLGRPYPQRHSIELTSAQMRGMAGVYKLGKGRRTIFVQEGKLYTKRDGGAAHLLRASSSSELYFDEVLDYFTIVRDRTGRVVALDQFMDGEPPAHRLPKLDEAVQVIVP
ncbi:MAG: serine hydrolase domain-containing protein [Dokdonella sp.]